MTTRAEEFMKELDALLVKYNACINLNEKVRSYYSDYNIEFELTGYKEGDNYVHGEFVEVQHTNYTPGDEVKFS